MKLMRRCLFLFGSVSLIGALGGCGRGGPEALPTTPVVEEGDKVIVEGIEEKPRTKGLELGPGPLPLP